jgi:hypothetical protein
VLDRLYRSFGHDEGGEPDWSLIRAQFVEGAMFAGEEPDGASPEPVPVDAFIAGWRDALRKSGASRPVRSEKIIRREMNRGGRLICVDIEFVAEKAGDPQTRMPGLDSLTLVRDAVGWKVLSFVVHYESKL